MWVWDYNLPKNWQPKTDFEWRWYLTRAINYGLAGQRLDPLFLKKHLPYLKIDPHKKKFLEFILKKDKNENSPD